MIVLVGGEKGGTGKTTLATNLAALRAQAGYDVLLVDTDRQGTAAAWCHVRQEIPHRSRVACVQLFSHGLQAEVRDLATRYADVFIDAGGRDSVELRSAMVVAQRVMIPILPSQYDVWTLDHMQELVTAARGFNPLLDALVVLSRVSPNPLITDAHDAQLSLEQYPALRLAETAVCERQAYRRSARQGEAVTELERPDAKASTEMRLLYEEVFHG
jgi:chromosome partitioning protein